jgi:putative ATP-dependent endonuclease of the OLD family
MGECAFAESEKGHDQMMLLRLRVHGFRGIEKADIKFSGHTVLIGPNGCGKSSIVDALSLVLGRTRMVRPLTEHDFTASDPGPASRIRIVATVAGFSSDDPGDHEDWFQSGRAVPKWFDEHGQEHTEPGPNRKLCANLGFCSRFDRDELEIISVRYFHDDDDTTDPFDDDGGVAQIPARFTTEIGLFVLPAKRDWDAVASFNSDLFRRTVSNAAGIPADEVILQRDALRNPSTKIENATKLSALVDGLNARLERLAPDAPKFQLRVTEGDCESVLKALLPHYSTSTGTSLPAARHGSGLVSLQSLLLLLEVGRVRLEKGLPFMLALEEPELHLAPGLQGRLVAEALKTADQVICTTHSSEIAKVFNSTNVLIVTNHNRQLSANPFLARALNTSATNNERKLFIQNRGRVVSALMLPFVLVPEGRFDAEWLSRFAEIADCRMTRTTPFSAVFGVVPTENASVVFTASKLAPLRSRLVALVDGDSAGDEYLAGLLGNSPPPHAIFQLPPGWTIEDVVRWILEPGGAVVLAAVQRDLPAFPFSTLDELGTLLKTVNNQKSKTVGLKEDVLAHEAIVSVVESNPSCLTRVVEFCEALVSTATRASHARVVKQTSSTANTSVCRFQP